ncbi:MAG: glycosyltransferase [Dermatophilus congolensis]|nr:glycosyltransferase [Dermatophilus congolensis]
MTPSDWLLGWTWFVPLGILGVIRWLSWAFRRIPAVLYHPVVSDYRAPLSIVVPVYKEEPELFARAIESWLANDPAEVILVIDSTDAVCQEIAARYPVTIVITDVPGKRDALRRGWEAASTPLVALVDSDTVWAPDVAEHVCMPFIDPEVGGVGTRQNVWQPSNFLQRINDMFLDLRYFDENAGQTYFGRAVSCLSGRTAVYRREILLDISDEFMAETFWGRPCMSGDDKRLTCLTMIRGHKTVMQRSARVWSTFPDTFKVFFKQRLRWARNTWRSDLRALFQGWVFKHPYLAYTMIDKAVSAFTLLIAPVYMIFGLATQRWSFCLALAIWWWLSRAVKLLPHLRRRPWHFFLLPGYVLMSFVMAIIKIQALLTIRTQRWLTRPVEVTESGEIARTPSVTDGQGQAA